MKILSKFHFLMIMPDWQIMANEYEKEVCQNFILILPSANSSIFLSFSSQQLHSEMFDSVIQGVTLTWDYNYIHITQKKPKWFNVCCNVDTIIQIYHIFSIIKANENIPIKIYFMQSVMFWTPINLIKSLRSWRNLNVLFETFKTLLLCQLFKVPNITTNHLLDLS